MTDPLATDFALASGSPAENARAVAASFPVTDFSGGARDDGAPDIGAFER